MNETHEEKDKGLNNGCKICNDETETEICETCQKYIQTRCIFNIGWADQIREKYYVHVATKYIRDAITMGCSHLEVRIKVFDKRFDHLFKEYAEMQGVEIEYGK